MKRYHHFLLFTFYFRNYFDLNLYFHLLFHLINYFQKMIKNLKYYFFLNKFNFIRYIDNHPIFIANFKLFLNLFHFTAISFTI